MLVKLRKYEMYLLEEEKSENTIEKYIRDIRKFIMFINEDEIRKSDVIAFKNSLLNNYKPSSINSILVSVNGFLSWLGCGELKVKLLKRQKEIFTIPEKELSQAEYKRIVNAAEKKKNHKLSLLIQTICVTGIRISELQYITVESLKQGRVTVCSKRKNRMIFIPKEFCKVLVRYCRNENIKAGSIFISKTGKPLNRSNIWRMMKNLCKAANVLESKVFPHNLRHLFARTYYKIEKDISKLADILGHTNINTTRIYTIESGKYHARQVDKMKLAISVI